MTVVIETGFSGDVYDMTHGRVCWDWTTNGTITATSAAAGFAAANALPPRTDKAWRPSGSGSQVWTQTFTAARTVSFVGIAKHDLGTQTATVNVQYSDDAGATWTSFPGTNYSPTTDAPILFLLDPISVDAVRLQFTSATAPPTISVIAVGETDEWPQRFEWIGQPITEGDRIGFENQTTITGNWIGRTKVDDGLSFDLTMNHASEAWRAGAFADFKAHANGEGATFFVAARPDDYPNEVAYAWLTDTARAERGIANKAISTSVTLSCQGLRPNG